MTAQRTGDRWHASTNDARAQSSDDPSPAIGRIDFHLSASVGAGVGRSPSLSSDGYDLLSANFIAGMHFGRFGIDVEKGFTVPGVLQSFFVALQNPMGGGSSPFSPSPLSSVSVSFKAFLPSGETGFDTYAFASPGIDISTASTITNASPSVRRWGPGIRVGVGGFRQLSEFLSVSTNNGLRLFYRLSPTISERSLERGYSHMLMLEATGHLIFDVDSAAGL